MKTEVQHDDQITKHQRRSSLAHGDDGSTQTGWGKASDECMVGWAQSEAGKRFNDVVSVLIARHGRTFGFKWETETPAGILVCEDEEGNGFVWFVVGEGVVTFRLTLDGWEKIRCVPMDDEKEQVCIA